MQRLQILETGIGILGLALVVLGTAEAFRQYGLSRPPSPLNRLLLRLQLQLLGGLCCWWMLFKISRMPVVQGLEAGMGLMVCALVILTIAEAFRRYVLGQGRSEWRFLILKTLLGLLGLLWLFWLLLSRTYVLYMLGEMIRALVCSLGGLGIVEFFRQDDFPNQPSDWTPVIVQLIVVSVVLLAVIWLFTLITLGLSYSVLVAPDRLG
jgi:hypothetical protein